MVSLFSRPLMVGGIGNVWGKLVNWSEGLGVQGQTPGEGHVAKPLEGKHFFTNYKKF